MNTTITLRPTTDRYCAVALRQMWLEMVPGARIDDRDEDILHLPAGCVCRPVHSVLPSHAAPHIIRSLVQQQRHLHDVYQLGWLALDAHRDLVLVGGAALPLTPPGLPLRGGEVQLPLTPPGLPLRGGEVQLPLTPPGLQLLLVSPQRLRRIGDRVPGLFCITSIADADSCPEAVTADNKQLPLMLSPALVSTHASRAVVAQLLDPHLPCVARFIR